MWRGCCWCDECGWDTKSDSIATRSDPSGGGCPWQRECDGGTHEVACCVGVGIWSVVRIPTGGNSRTRPTAICSCSQHVSSSMSLSCLGTVVARARYAWHTRKHRKADDSQVHNLESRSLPSTTSIDRQCVNAATARWQSEQLDESRPRGASTVTPRTFGATRQFRECNLNQIHTSESESLSGSSGIWIFHLDYRLVLSITSEFYAQHDQRYR